MSPELYRLLVLDRRWAPERYEQWLTELLAEQLLPPLASSPEKGNPVRADDGRR
jgi:hypothetical protein